MSEFFVKGRTGVQPARRNPPTVYTVEDTTQKIPSYLPMVVIPGPNLNSPPKVMFSTAGEIRVGTKLIPKDSRRVGSDPIVVVEVLNDSVRTSKGRTIKASRLNLYEVL